MKVSAVAPLFGAIALASCSADTRAAEDAVQRFHAQYNSGQHGEIYASSDKDMKGAMPEDEFLKFLGGLRTKMGAFKSGKTVGWNVNVGTGGRLTTLNREGVFERGKANEQFVFRGEAEDIRLAGYHISSPALVTN